MAVSAKKIGFHGTVGFLVAALIIVGVVISSVKIPSLRPPSFIPDTGTLIVKLTDAPVELKHLNVTISHLSVYALRAEDGEETWEELTFVGGVPEFSVDILALRDVTEDLSVTEIPPGNYTKLRMTITTAKATYLSGETVDLMVPPGHVDVIVHFEIKAGETTIVVVDMEADWVAISQSQRLRPVLKATVIPPE